jgi:hypothetical protein
MVRCSHYPQAEAFSDACDELGLMAWEEAAGWGYLGDEAWKALAYRDIGEMIVRDRSHPSIIVWGARLNETPNDTAFCWWARARSTSPRRAAPARPGSGPGPAGRAWSRSGPAIPVWATRSPGSGSASAEPGGGQYHPVNVHPEPGRRR